MARVGTTELCFRTRPLSKQRWYHVVLDVHLADGGTITGTLTPHSTRSPGGEQFEPSETHTARGLDPRGPHRYSAALYTGRIS